MPKNKANHWSIVDLSGEANGGASVKVYVEGLEVPVAQFSMTYGLNSIPSATALIALGRNARTQVDSTIYQRIPQIKQMAAVTVKLTGNLGDWAPSGGSNNKQQKFPSGPATLFVGYVAGISYRRSAGQVSMALNMVNRLVDLDMSAAGSRDVVPGAPHDLLLTTLPPGPGAEKAATAGTKFVKQLPSDLRSDFSKGLLTSLLFIAKNNQIQTHEGSVWCKGKTAAPLFSKSDNTRAVDAINGSGPDWKGIARTAGIAKYTEAYPLKVSSAGIELASKSIGETLAASLAGTSMWNTLIGSLLPVFGCGIIPMATGAILAPILNNARTHRIAIDTSDYADFDMTMMSKRPLYGVGVMGNYQFGSLSVGQQKQCVGAVFTASAGSGSLNDGMWMFVAAPGWMDDWTNFDPQALQGQADVNRMLGKPSHDAVGHNSPAITRNPESEVDGWNGVMQQYARLVYANNSLHGREGTLVGKLRFDVAPGTTILVRSKGSAQSGGVDELACDMFAFVAQVTVTINAEQASAATSFVLTNIRTEEENKLTRFSMDTHPFFDTAYFKYAPLVPELSLEPQI